MDDEAQDLTQVHVSAWCGYQFIENIRWRATLRCSGHQGLCHAAQSEAHHRALHAATAMRVTGPEDLGGPAQKIRESDTNARRMDQFAQRVRDILVAAEPARVCGDVHREIWANKPQQLCEHRGSGRKLWVHIRQCLANALHKSPAIVGAAAHEGIFSQEHMRAIENLIKVLGNKLKRAIVTAAQQQSRHIMEVERDRMSLEILGGGQLKVGALR